MNGGTADGSGKTQALIIVGHGSHLSATSSAPVYRHADAVRTLGAFAEVRECFWKEEPSLRVVLDLVEADEVFIVPLFMSEGYFTEEVIPRELSLDGPAPSVTRIGARTVYYCAPVGTHPGMSGLILRRAEETAGLSDEEAGSAGLLVIGHGTERNPRSSEVVYEVAAGAREENLFASVRVGFLDQAPEVDEVLGEMTEKRIVLVPFFVAEGWHTQETIPDDLGIRRPDAGRVSELAGRTIYYTAPVGTFPEVADIVVQRAREAGAEIHSGRSGEMAHV